MVSIRIPSFILRAPAPIRPLLFTRYASESTASRLAEHLPRVAQPSLWRSLVPRYFRRRDGAPSDPQKQPGLLSRFFANPASGVIILAMLTGNASIHLLRTKREMIATSRETEKKLELLREVLERVQAGEDVDVEKMLGTGDPKMEQEWADAMREVEADEGEETRQERKVARRMARKEERRKEEEARKAAESASSSEGGTKAADDRPSFM